MDLVTRRGAVALSGLRRQEEAVAVLREPRRESQLRLAVRRGSVDVVDVVLEQQLERAVRLRLRDRAQRRGAEERSRALVARAAERRSFDHAPRLDDCIASASARKPSAHGAGT